MSKEENISLMVWVPISGTQNGCLQKLQTLLQGLGAGTDMGPAPVLLALTVAQDIMESVKKMKSCTGSININIGKSNIDSPLPLKVVRER